MGNGVKPLRMCINLLDMDFNALLEPIVAFFSDGIGAVIAQIGEFFYNVLFPANAEAAHTTPEM